MPNVSGGVNVIVEELMAGEQILLLASYRCRV
jgi:hypothetical protein